MPKQPWTPRGGRRGPATPKSDLRAQADAEVAAFLAGGGKVSRGPDVVPTRFMCTTCGRPSMVGITPGRRVRCPLCRTLSDAPAASE